MALLTAYGARRRAGLRRADEPLALAVHRRLESDISYVAGAPLTENLGRFVAFTLVTSLGFDIPRALTTAALVAVAARPVLLALRRAARRAEFGAVPEFAPQDGTMSG